MKKLISLSLGILITLTAGGCARTSSFEAVSPEDRIGLTGHTSDDGRLYTVGGDPRLQKESHVGLDLDLGPNYSPELAQRIQKVAWTRQKDRLTLAVTISDEGTTRALTFAHPMDTSTLESRHVLDLKPTQATENPQYSLHGSIAQSADLSSPALGRLYLVKKNSHSSQPQEAQIFTRSYLAKVGLQKEQKKELRPALAQQFEVLEKESQAQVTNTIIPQGRSWYTVDLKKKGESLLVLEGEATRTGTQELAPSQVRSTQEIKIKHAELLGDAEVEDARTFNLAAEDEDGQLVNFALIVNGQDSTEGSTSKIRHTPPSVVLKSSMTDAYFPIRTEGNYPGAKKMLLHFNQNYDIPGVQQWIDRITSASTIKLLENKLKNIAPFRSLIVDIFHNYDVAPSSSLLALVESPFFDLTTYPILTNKTSTATGPFQLILGTAKSLDMRVDAQQSYGQLPSTQDERRYFAPSACAAARHLRQSYDRFHERDATIALLAYHLGDQGATNKIQCALDKADCQKRKKISSWDLVQKYSFNYKTLAQQKMIDTKLLNYVNRTLAYHFVTSNPKEFGLQFPNLSEVQDLPLNKTLPPKPVNDPSCRAVITAL